MISLKILSTVAALAVLVPAASFAQGTKAGGGGGGGAPAVGGGGGGAPAVGGGGGGFYPGLAFGGAYASSYYGPGYYDQGYYGDYYDEPAVEVSGGGGDVAYCQQRYRSYDIRTGTYLGYDGLRHPCP